MKTKTLLLLGAAGVVGYLIWQSQKKSTTTKSTSTGTTSTSGGAAASIVSDLTSAAKSIASAFGKSSQESSGTVSSGSTSPVDPTDNAYLKSEVQGIEAEGSGDIVPDISN